MQSENIVRIRLYFEIPIAPVCLFATPFWRELLFHEKEQIVFY